MALVWCVTACSDDDPAEGEDERWYEDEAALRADYMHALADAQWPDDSKVSKNLMPISEENKDLEWITIETDGNMGVDTRGMETPRRSVCRLRLHRLALPHDTDAGPMAGV